MNDTLLVILVGLAMGFFGSIPPLGPVALMIIDRAFRKEHKFAFFAGVGGALAEVIYSALAVTGVGLVLKRFEAGRDLLALISAGILLVVGVYFFVRTRREADERARENDERARENKDAASRYTAHHNPSERPEQTFAACMGHLGRGFSIAIVNPILIVNWTLAVAYFFSLFRLRADLGDQILFALAVGVGKVVWTAIEVWLLEKFRQHFSLDWMQRLQKGVSIAVILSALLLVVRTVASF